MGSVADGDGFDVEDETDGVLIRGCPKLGNIGVKLVYLSIFFFALSTRSWYSWRLSAVSISSSLTLGGLAQPGDIVVPDVD